MKIKMLLTGVMLSSSLMWGMIESENLLVRAERDWDAERRERAEREGFPLDRVIEFMNSIHLADEVAPIEALEALWDESMDLRKMDDWGYTPLLYALLDDTPASVAIVDFLLRKGAHVNDMRMCSTPLGIILTCEQNFERRMEKVRLLVEAGANTVPLKHFNREQQQALGSVHQI
jgi:hypothetical protein